MAIVAHRHADVDAYCSAYTVAEAIKRLSKSVEVHVSSPGGLSFLAERLRAQFPLEIISEPSFQDLDLLVIVDTGDAALLESWAKAIREASCERVLIDHHPPSASLGKLVEFSVIDQKASSTSEIVFNLWRRLKLTPSRSVAQAVLLGIMADSGFLTRATEDTIYDVEKLCKLGASLQKSRSLLRVRPERSELIARLKGARRIRIFEVGKWMVAITRVGSFQASVARSLLDLGADLGVAIGARAAGSRASLRSKEEFYDESGVHLGIDVAQKISERIRSGSGGGHATAASVQCGSRQSRLYEEATYVISEALGEQLKQID